MLWPLDLLLSLVVPLAGWFASLALRRWAAARGTEVGGELAFAGGLALALGWAQLCGMALGFGQLLRPVFVLPLLLLGLVAALAYGRGELRRSLAGGTVLLPSLLVLVPYLLMATFPPWDRDEMVYHLALPRAFALAGGYTKPDDNIFASFPLGWESVQAVLHTLGRAPGDPPFNPRLLGVWTAWGGALATSALARELGAKRLAWSAGVLLLLVPTFVEFGSSAYVEPYLLLCSSLAMIAVLRVLRGEEGWLLAAGLMAGLATSIKYPGLAVAGLLAVALGARGEPERRPQRALRFVALCALVGGAFYLRNLLQRGNPFFPMAYGLFGGEGWDDVRAEAYWESLRMYGAGDGFLGTLSAPLRLFFARDFLTGLEGSVGPLPLLLALAALGRPLQGERSGTSRLLLLFSALFALFWLSTVVQARFFLVALPPLLAVGGAWIEEQAPKLLPLALVGAVAWGAGGFLFLWQRQPTSAWLGGSLSKEQALTRVLPQSYPPLRALHGVVSADARVWMIWMRGYTYYMDFPYKIDSVYEEWRFANLLDRSTDKAQFLGEMRKEGVSYVLLNEQFFLNRGSSDTRPGRTAALRQRFEALVGEGALVARGRWGRVVLYGVSGVAP